MIAGSSPRDAIDEADTCCCTAFYRFDDVLLAAGDKGAKPVYPKAKTVEQVDDYFGTKVSDPYRWMEDVDSAEVKQWVDAENVLTQRYLATVPSREKMHSRLMELTNFERYTAPARRGTRYFYSHNGGCRTRMSSTGRKG